MKIMLLGDTHGQANVLAKKIRLAEDLDIHRLVVMGDFGIWPGPEGVRFLDEVNGMAMSAGVEVIAIPGNHEDHDQWGKWFDVAPITENGFARVRSSILLTKKVHYFTIEDKRFFVAGGAVSIDRAWRQKGISWWPNETFSEANMASVKRYRGKPIDYLLTHDCSNHTPFGMSLVPDPDSRDNRLRIDEAIAHLRPRYHFHGHMHRKYEWVNTRTHDVLGDGCSSTDTFGLDSDDKVYSWGVLDTDSDTFTWSMAALA